MNKFHGCTSVMLNNRVIDYFLLCIHLYIYRNKKEKEINKILKGFLT